MSEIERAIESLQNIIEYWTYKPEEMAALKLAIKALKEKQQREDDDRQRCYGYYADCENTGQYGITPVS